MWKRWPGRAWFTRPHCFKFKFMEKSKLFRWLLVMGLIFLLAGFLAQVFAGQWVLPQAFRVGPLTLHYYGLTMATAVLVGLLYARKTGPDFGFTPEQAENLALYLVPVSFVFARAYHVMSSFSYYRLHPLDALKVWQGGLSIYGAVLGGVLVLILAKKVLRLQTSTLNLFDWLAPAVLLGQIVGRFGNFFNYEAYGLPTNLPWKMFVPPDFRLAGYWGQAYYHPWFLYEALGNLLIFWLLIKHFKKQGPGSLFFGYILLYNIWRFCLEFIRIDSVFVGSVRQNAAVSLALVFVGVIGLIMSRGPQNAKIS